jgi:hypothetical protein
MVRIDQQHLESNRVDKAIVHAYLHQFHHFSLVRTQNLIHDSIEDDTRQLDRLRQLK